MWWLCSVFNVFMISYSKGIDTVITRHCKSVFVVEFLVSVLFPAAMVAVVMGINGTYNTFSVYVVICGPPTPRLYYYTFALPLQVIVFFGCVLIMLIVLRVRKVGSLTTR